MNKWLTIYRTCAAATCPSNKKIIKFPISATTAKEVICSILDKLHTKTVQENTQSQQQSSSTKNTASKVRLEKRNSSIQPPNYRCCSPKNKPKEKKNCAPPVAAVAGARGEGEHRPPITGLGSPSATVQGLWLGGALAERSYCKLKSTSPSQARKGPEQHGIMP
jgi:hypothetical protein